MKLDLQTVPFSRFGAYLAFSLMAERPDHPAGLYLRSVHGGHATYAGPALRFELLFDGQPAPFTVDASATVLNLVHPNGRVQICMPEPEHIRLRGQQAGLRISAPAGTFDYLFQVDEQHWQINHASWGTQFILTNLLGNWRMNSPWHGVRAEHLQVDFQPGPDGQFEAAFEEVETVWRSHGYPQSFDEAVETVMADFLSFRSAAPDLPEEYAEACDLAAYINWSSIVEPSGHLNWPAMLMSKNWMNSVWSWDHCFNAMALTYNRPVLAWDQIRVIFDMQDMYGELPDLVNDRSVVWNFVKPPIHGWTLSWMMERTNFIRKEQLHQMYGPLCRWTEWWFSYRDYDRDGIPQYHHGNDSGWDNATPFKVGVPLESPDLCAFLILQMETLARMATRLGNQEEAESWQRRSEQLLDKMMAHFWQDDHFVAMRSGDHLVADSESLFLYLPLILGKRLPLPVRRELIAGLTRPGRFLTPFGLATESPQSPDYQPDGYWRGPIWAPSTLLIVEGLAACGELDLARDIARRFCDMAARSGFAENFDALTGAGLRDRAYTWTASVFLVLGHEYLLKK